MKEEHQFLKQIDELNSLAGTAKATGPTWEIYLTGSTTSVQIIADTVTFEGGVAVFRLKGEVRQAFAPAAWTFVFKSPV